MSIYKCEICGKLFDRVGNGVYCPGPHYRPCPVCGKPVRFHRPSEPYKCCSKECRRIKFNGSMEKHAKPMKCVICGKEFMSSQTNQKYCSGPHKSICVVCGDEFEYTCHPSDAPSTCSQECQNILRLRSTGVSQDYDIPNSKTPHWKPISVVNGSDDTSDVSDIIVEPTHAANPILEIQQYIESLDVKVIQNYLISDTISADIWIPKYNIGIRYLDVIQTSIYSCISEKTIFSISSHDWENRSDIIRNAIKYFLKRSMTSYLVKPLDVRPIDSVTVTDFISANSVQHDINFNSAFGLYSSDSELLATMTFELLDHSSSGGDMMCSWRITSYCVKTGVRVSSGYKKLIKQFIYRYIPSNLLITKSSAQYNYDLFDGFSNQFDLSNSAIELNLEDYCKMKSCVLCGKKFIPKTSAQRVCYDNHYRYCKFCGKEFKVMRPSDSQQCCSKSCTSKLRKSTMIDRFGVPYSFQSPELVEKRNQTNIARYGTPYPSKLQEFKDKSRNTNMERYGVPNKSMLPEVKEQVMNTCMERYGVKFSSQIPGRNEKMRKTNLSKYGVEYPLQSEEIREKTSKTMEERYGVPWYCMSDDYIDSVGTVVSKINKSFSELLYQSGIQNAFEFRIGRRSYDIHIINSNLLIEINPTYTHNSIGTHWNSGVDKYYHQMKTKLAEENGYHCIHVFDWMSWNNVVEMIKNHDRLKFSEIGEPRLWMSKNDKAFIVTDPEDIYNLIEAGWLPVYDSGQDIFIG